MTLNVALRNHSQTEQRRRRETGGQQRASRVGHQQPNNVLENPPPPPHCVVVILVSTCTSMCVCVCGGDVMFDDIIADVPGVQMSLPWPCWGPLPPPPPPPALSVCNLWKRPQTRSLSLRCQSTNPGSN